MKFNNLSVNSTSYHSGQLFINKSISMSIE